MPAEKIADAKDKTEAPKIDAVESQQPKHSYRNPLLIVLLLVGVLFVLGGMFAAGRHAAYMRNENAFVRGDYSRVGTELSTGGFGGQMGFRGSMMYGDQGGPSSAPVNNTRVRGVVTVMDGSTITVAGDGMIIKVSVSSNTTYGGSSEPAKVNDSILAVGAKDSSGTLVASNVYLTRQ